MQAIDLYARLAAALSSGDDLPDLLTRLLEPIVQLSRARAGCVRLKNAEDGRLTQIGTLELDQAQAGGERVVVIALTHRGRSFGEYELRLGPGVVTDEPTACFQRTIGALLGLALHDAGVARESQQAIAADVHDGIAQTLVFARMRMPLLEGAIASHDEIAALRYCGDVRQAVASAQTKLRAILSQCRAPIDPQGLKHALRSSIQSFEALTHINLVFEDRAPNLRLSAGQEMQMFLVMQEALANIAKHAHARHAWLTLDQHGDEVDVIVEDDGAGMPAAPNTASPSHFGMDIMRHRAALLGGSVGVTAREGGGLRLRLSFPATAREAAAA